MRYDELDTDECMLCGAYGEDKRSLVMRCFYDLTEVVPEMISLRNCSNEAIQNDGYFLRTCKVCRGALLGALREWAIECRKKHGTPMDHDGYPLVEQDNDKHIPVRIDGTIKMISDDEFEELLELRRAQAEHMEDVP